MCVIEWYFYSFVYYCLFTHIFGVLNVWLTMIAIASWINNHFKSAGYVRVHQFSGDLGPRYPRIDPNLADGRTDEQAKTKSRKAIRLLEKRPRETESMRWVSVWILPGYSRCIGDWLWQWREFSKCSPPRFDRADQSWINDLAQDSDVFRCGWQSQSNRRTVVFIGRSVEHVWSWATCKETNREETWFNLITNDIFDTLWSSWLYW